MTVPSETLEFEHAHDVAELDVRGLLKTSLLIVSLGCFGYALYAGWREWKSDSVDSILRENAYIRQVVRHEVATFIAEQMTMATADEKAPDEETKSDEDKVL